MRIFRPALTAFIPEGWLVRETIHLAWPDRNAYVVASSDVVPDAMTPEEYAREFEALAEGLPGYEELSRETVELPGGRPAFVRRSRWTRPEGDPVAQLQMYVVAQGRGIVATARVAEESFAELEPRLREVLTGIGAAGRASASGILRRDDSARSQTYEALETGRLTTSVKAAFGLDATNGDEPKSAPDQAPIPWNDARASWQEEL